MHEQINTLVARVARMQKVEEELAELLQINDKLVKELELRDEAVREAVEIICDLEAKIDAAGPANGDVRLTPIQSNLDALKAAPPGSTTPEKCSPGRKAPLRKPSFLCDKKPSTNALRNAYLDPARTLRPVQSFMSILSEREGRDEDASNQGLDLLNSPMLSVLSESSSIGIYEDLRQPVDHQDEEFGRQDSMLAADQRVRRDSFNRVNQWMQHGRLDALGTHGIETSTTPDPARPSGLHRGASDWSGMSDDKNKKSARHLTTDEGVYEDGLLPPTPDSVSTRMLRRSRSSNLDRKPLNERRPSPSVSVADRQPTSPPQQTLDEPRTNESYFVDKTAPVVQDEIDDQQSETASSTVRDLGSKHSRHATGFSFDLGTPSRFQSQHATPPPANMLFNGDGIVDIERCTPKRRKSSAEVHTSSKGRAAARPSFGRAETSPTEAFANRASTMASTLNETTPLPMQKKANKEKSGFRRSGFLRRLSNARVVESPGSIYTTPPSHPHPHHHHPQQPSQQRAAGIKPAERASTPSRQVRSEHDNVKGSLVRSDSYWNDQRSPLKEHFSTPMSTPMTKPMAMPMNSVLRRQSVDPGMNHGRERGGEKKSLLQRAQSLSKRDR